MVVRLNVRWLLKAYRTICRLKAIFSSTCFDGRAFSPTLNPLSFATAAGFEYSVTGASGDEILVEFSEHRMSEVVFPESGDAPETTVGFGEEGSITTIKVGAATYTVTHDANGNAVLTSATESTTTRRTQMVDLDFADRRLDLDPSDPNCEDDCGGTTDAGCDGLATLCDPDAPDYGVDLTAICLSYSLLCADVGLEVSCTRACAPCEYDLLQI